MLEKIGILSHLPHVNHKRVSIVPGTGIGAFKPFLVKVFVDNAVVNPHGDAFEVIQVRNDKNPPSFSFGT